MNYLILFQLFTFYYSSCCLYAMFYTIILAQIFQILNSIFQNYFNNYFFKSNTLDTSSDFAIAIKYYTYFIILINLISGFILLLTNLFRPTVILDLIFSLLAYLYYSSTYINSLILFAFCNIDDVNFYIKILSKFS